MGRSAWITLGFAVLLLSVVVGRSSGEHVTTSASRPPVVGQPQPLSDGQLVTHFAVADGQPPTIVVVEPKSRVLAVYHVSPQSGEIILQSVRNVHWDLQMTEFNSSKQLSPQQIRDGWNR